MPVCPPPPSPSGVVILSTYKFGSHRMGLESGGFALPGLAWLGLRSSWLADVEEAYMQVRLEQTESNGCVYTSQQLCPQDTFAVISAS